MRLDELRARIGNATLVAVSKGHSVEEIQKVYDRGVRDFGENYLHELAAKEPHFPDARWHFQGRLQRRKIRDIVKFSSSILSVARLEELEEIEKRAESAVTCYIEVNIAEESQKNGVMPADLGVLLERTFPKIRIDGLMTVPPSEGDPRPWFAKLRELAQAHGLEKLSMGMSSDYEIALEEGATMVRIGTAIFGERRSV